jgi:hypothetical protein
MDHTKIAAANLRILIRSFVGFLRELVGKGEEGIRHEVVGFLERVDKLTCDGLWDGGAG